MANFRLDEIGIINETQEYNHALFESMTYFCDAVWEINLREQTVYILYDNFTKACDKKIFSLDDVKETFLRIVHPDDIDKVFNNYDMYYLDSLMKSVSFESRVLVEGSYNKVRQVLTPCIENDRVTYVYVTFQSIQDIIDQVASLKGATSAIHKELEHRNVVLQALSEGISCIFNVNFDNDTYYAEQLNDLLRTEVSDYVRRQSNKYSQSIKGYCLQYVHPDDLYRMMNELKIENIISNLKEKNSYYLQYKVNANKDNAGYFEVHISDSDSNNPGHKGFMSFRCIDEQKKSEYENKKIKESLISVYSSLYEICIEERTITAIRLSDDLSKYFNPGVKYNLDGFLDIYVDKFVLENYKEKLTGFLSDEKLSEQLKLEDYSVFEFECVNKGFVRATVVPDKLDLSGSVQTLFLGIQSVDKEKKKEIEKIELKDEISDIYSCIYYFTVRGGICNVIRQQKDLSTCIPEDRAFDIRTLVSAYTEKAVEPVFRDKVQRFLDIRTISDRFETVNSLSAEYECLNVGWCRGTLIVLKRDVNNYPESMAFCIQIIEDEKRKELKKYADLSEEHKEILRVNKVKSEVYSQIYKKIKMSLSEISAIIDIAMTETSDSNKVKHDLEKIKSLSRNLFEAVNEGHDINVIESGKIELNAEEFNFKLLCNKLADAGRLLCKEKMQEFVVDNVDIKHEMVCGDSERIERSFRNIFLNSVNHTDKCESIHVSFSEIPTNNERFAGYRFVCKKRAADQEYFSKPVTPYASYHNSSDNFLATDLSLNTSKNIIKLMDGDISVETDLNEGDIVRVTIYLPVIIDGETEELPGNQSGIVTDELKNQKEFNGERVLLVEDNDMNADIVKEVLNKAGLYVERVSDGNEAVEKIFNTKDYYYSLILMDIYMPVMDGYEATKVIRSMGKDYTKNIPILGMTVNAFNDNEDDYKKAGMNDFILKYMSFNHFKQIIRKYIKN